MWTGIEWLIPLQEFRLANPWTEDFFLAMSSRAVYLALPIMIALAFYWFVDKRKGEIIGLGCVSAMVFSMTVKYGIGLPRPWEMDSRIIHVPGAHDAGLSCPSGHTAISVSAFGSVAVMCRKWAVSIVMLVLIALILMSRLVLCVHTPLDVIVGIVIAVVMTLIAWKAVNYAYTDGKAFGIVAAGYLIFFTVLFIIGLTLWNGDAEDISTFAGFFYGAMVGMVLEYRYVGYEVPDVSVKEKAKRYLIGMLVGLVILGIFISIPYGLFVGGFIMMIWCFFLYPRIMTRSGYFQ